MKMLFFALFLLPLGLYAQLSVAVTYPYIGSVVEKIGGENVDVNVLAPGNWDPHFVVARPSLIAKMRRADALIINGAQLEIGWLPALVARANNHNVQPGANGFLELSRHVNLIEKPETLSRSGGDVHPEGNPHFHLDPANILTIAEAVASHLAKLDAPHQEIYRRNFLAFEKTWHKNMARWNERMAAVKGRKVIQYHKSFEYFFRAYDLNCINTIEALPGVPPSSKHTMELIEQIKTQKPYGIFHDVYHSTKTADFISKHSGIPVITIPHDIGALDSIETLEGLFDYLTEAASK